MLKSSQKAEVVIWEQDFKELQCKQQKSHYFSSKEEQKINFETTEVDANW